MSRATLIERLLDEIEPVPAQMKAECEALAIADAAASTVTTADSVARRVYAKTGPALAELQALDALLAHYATVAARQTDDAADAIPPGPSLLAARAWAWIVTTPGHGLPYAIDADAEPPDWTARLTSHDLAALAERWAEVQARSTVAAIVTDEYRTALAERPEIYRRGGPFLLAFYVKRLEALDQCLS